ncbi:hypothetical protein D3C76_1218750 [compost metagenome]
MLYQMGKKQRRGGTQRELVGRLLPVAAEDKMAVQGGNAGIVAKQIFVQGKAVRAFIPDLLPDVAQVRVGTVEMDKRQIVADIPAGFALFWHQAEAIRAAAVFPARVGFVIALVAVGNIEAQGVVIAILRNGVTFI